MSDADVVIVGYGSAGAAAAITAADLGTSVLVLEKQPSTAHTPSSRIAAAVVMTVNDVEGAVTYLDGCAQGLIPTEINRQWAERALRIGDWIEAVGTGLTLEPFRDAQHSHLDGFDSIVVNLARDAEEVKQGEQLPEGLAYNKLGFVGAGAAASGAGRLFDGLDRAVKQRPSISVVYDAPATRLIREDGRISGVIVERDGEEERIGARLGVILTSGGFEFNEEMKANFISVAPVEFYGNPGNTGDGIKMAQEMGADLWHMNQLNGRGIGKFWDDTIGDYSRRIIHIHPPGYVITDRFGDRYADESGQARTIEHTFYRSMLEFDQRHKAYTRSPSYWFFDESRLDAGSITAARHAGDWPADNRAPIDRGWILRGDTIAEVAAAAGIEDPENAQRTIEEYNRLCSSGEPDPFGRPAETMIALDGPPYYCVLLYPGGPNTYGGPRRNEFSQVLDPFHRPIPGLYAAGELGAPMGQLYPSSGSQFSEALAFGQIAAEHLIKN